MTKLAEEVKALNPAIPSTAIRGNFSLSTMFTITRFVKSGIPVSVVHFSFARSRYTFAAAACFSPSPTACHPCPTVPPAPLYTSTHRTTCPKVQQILHSRSRSDKDRAKRIMGQLNKLHIKYVRVDNAPCIGPISSLRGLLRYHNPT